MKVALVIPNSQVTFYDTAPPINLGYIAAYVRQQLPAVEIKVFDGILEKNVWA
jgi:hypothetical protein